MQRILRETNALMKIQKLRHNSRFSGKNCVNNKHMYIVGFSRVSEHNFSPFASYDFVLNISSIYKIPPIQNMFLTFKLF